MTDTLNSTATADEILSGIDLKGKRFLITGISSGIGRETVRALAARGATVVGTVKAPAHAASATRAIHEAATHGGGILQLLPLDLASLKSVRVVADGLLSDGSRFDAIIANAGVMATPFGRTIDGFETQFGINYLGHCALVNRLAPLLAKDARLVVLSSQAHRVADVDLADPHFEHQAYQPFVACGRLKTAITLIAVEFDKRYREQGIRPTAVMPGNSQTDLTRNFSEEQLSGLFETVAKSRAEAGLPPGQLKGIGQAAATSV